MDTKFVTSIEFVNNFSEFIEDFTKDTKEPFSTSNMPIYISYLNARLLDRQNQIQATINNRLAELISKMGK